MAGFELGQANSEVSRRLAEGLRVLSESEDELDRGIVSEIDDLKDPSSETMQRLHKEAYRECFIDTPAQAWLWELAQIPSQSLSSVAAIEAVDAYSFVDPSEGLNLIEEIPGTWPRIEAYCRFGNNLGGEERLVFTEHARGLVMKQMVESQPNLFARIGALTGDPISLAHALTLSTAPQTHDYKFSKQAMRGNAIVDLYQYIKEKQNIERAREKAEIHNSPANQARFLLRLASLGYVPALNQAKRILVENEAELGKNGPPVFTYKEVRDHSSMAVTPPIIKKRVRVYEPSELSSLAASLMLIDEQIRLGNLEQIFDPVLANTPDTKLEMRFDNLVKNHRAEIEAELEKPVALPEEYDILETEIKNLWQKFAENSKFLTESDLWEYAADTIAAHKQRITSRVTPDLQILLDSIRSRDYLEYAQIPELEVPGTRYSPYKLVYDLAGDLNWRRGISSKKRRDDELGMGMVEMSKADKEEYVRNYHNERAKTERMITESMRNINERLLLRAINLFCTGRDKSGVHI